MTSIPLLPLTHFSSHLLYPSLYFLPLIVLLIGLNPFLAPRFLHLQSFFNSLTSIALSPVTRFSSHLLYPSLHFLPTIFLLIRLNPFLAPRFLPLQSFFNFLTFIPLLPITRFYINPCPRPSYFPPFFFDKLSFWSTCTLTIHFQHESICPESP